MFRNVIRVLLTALLLYCPHAGAAQLEMNTDRPGHDYRNLDIPAIGLHEASPNWCARECERDSRCRAFTYVPRNVQGPSARCWLKDQTSSPVALKGMISGVVTRQAGPPPAPTLPPSGKTIPNVVGKRFDVAHAELKNAGFTVQTGKSTISNDPAKYHTVHDQEPDGGKSAAPGSVVTLSILTPAPVSTTGSGTQAAVEKVRVPDIVGKDSSVAMNMLGDRGLHMNTTRIEPLGGISDRRGGQIAHQEPARGTEVSKGSTVNVRVFGSTR